MTRSRKKLTLIRKVRVRPRQRRADKGRKQPDDRLRTDGPVSSGEPHRRARVQYASFGTASCLDWAVSVLAVAWREMCSCRLRAWISSPQLNFTPPTSYALQPDSRPRFTSRQRPRTRTLLSRSQTCTPTGARSCSRMESSGCVGGLVPRRRPLRSLFRWVFLRAGRGSPSRSWTVNSCYPPPHTHIHTHTHMPGCRLRAQRLPVEHFLRLPGWPQREDHCQLVQQPSLQAKPKHGQAPFRGGRHADQDDQHAAPLFGLALALDTAGRRVSSSV